MIYRIYDMTEIRCFPECYRFFRGLKARSPLPVVVCLALGELFSQPPPPFTTICLRPPSLPRHKKRDTKNPDNCPQKEEYLVV